MHICRKSGVFVSTPLVGQAYKARKIRGSQGMRRLLLEVDYGPAWREIFGKNSENVHVLEVTKCLRCDTEGFALICRIKLEDKIREASDLLAGGTLTELETLYREKDGSLTVFIEGNWNASADLGNDWRRTKILQLATPDFIGPNRLKVEIVGKETDVQRVLEFVEKSRRQYRILALTSLDSRPRKILSLLTSRQRQALLAAYTLGYYDVPRRISSEQLGKRMKIDKSTLVEHLRKAERKILTNILSE